MAFEKIDHFIEDAPHIEDKKPLNENIGQQDGSLCAVVGVVLEQFVGPLVILVGFIHRIPLLALLTRFHEVVDPFVNRLSNGIMKRQGFIKSAQAGVEQLLHGGRNAFMDGPPVADQDTVVDDLLHECVFEGILNLVNIVFLAYHVQRLQRFQGSIEMRAGRRNLLQNHIIEYAPDNGGFLKNAFGVGLQMIQAA